jgi:spermidine/putrescine transport system permease protein
VAQPRSGGTVWGALTLPGTAWLGTFFLVPFYAIGAVAFGGYDVILARARPRWNPLDWQFQSFGNVVEDVLGGSLGRVLVRTSLYVVIATAMCFVIGYPVAYYAARHASRRKRLLLAILVVPFWMSYLMRMLAWVNLLNPEGGWAAGALNALEAPRLFHWMGLSDGTDAWFTQPITVVLGLVYGYVPFFILPLYAGLDRLDTRLAEAARDLGASARATFLRVTLPLSMPAVLASTVITALPMFGDYYTNSILSGSPRTTMIGNQIESLTRSSQPQRGAALVLIVSALLLVFMAYYLVVVVRQTRQANEARA